MRRIVVYVAAACLLGAVFAAGDRGSAQAGKGLPPTNVATQSGQIVVSTTASTARLDTSVYITGQTPGINFIFRTPIPATIPNDAWNCPCTAQIVYRAKSGTTKVLTAPSAPFTPVP